MILLLACSLSRHDLDGDGFVAPDDCDDYHHDVYPGAADVPYDGVDADCDGGDDYDIDGDGVSWPDDCDDGDAAVGGASSFHPDGDGDGYGDPSRSATRCDESGFVLDGGDCDDGDDAVHPDRDETCDNGIDDNCNGSADGCDLRGTFSAADAALDIDDAPRFGTALAFVPRLGGEGRPGVAVSAVPEGGAGVTTLLTGNFRGTAEGLERATWTPGTVTTNQPAIGESGYALTPVGDLDGDGDDEVLVGGYHASNHDGRAWILPGGEPRELGAADVVATLFGSGQEALGIAATRVEAEDGALLAVGAVGYCDACDDRHQGAAYVFDLPLAGEVTTAFARARVQGESLGDAAGNALAAPGDLDGDGIDDLVVAAINYGPGDHGAVYLWSAVPRDSTSLADADHRIEGEQDGGDGGEYFGVSVAGAGDTDGDGLRDLVVGAEGADDADAAERGAAYVILGPAAITTAADAHARVLGEAGDNFLGRTVAGGVDVDGDGFDEVLAGAPWAAEGANSLVGRAALLFGPVAAGTYAVADTDGRFYGEQALDRLGASVGLGDLDGDGQGDVLLGADAALVGHNVRSGHLYVFFGGGE